MARQASVLVLGAGTGAYNITQALAAASVATVTLGRYSMFEINADQDIVVTVGVSGTISTPTTSNGKRIPANQQVTLDIGAQNDTIKVLNLGTQNGTGGQTGVAAANIYITRLSVE